jgi:Na+/H+ antiporter NhaC
MNRVLLASTLLLLTSSASAQPLPQKIVIEAPATVLSGIPFDILVKAVDENGNPLVGYTGAPIIRGVSAPPSPVFENGVLSIEDAVLPASGSVVVTDGSLSAEATLRAIPAVLSILPPILAITLAIVFRQVILSLFAGVWLAGFFLNDYNLLSGFFAVLTHFVVDAVTTKSQAQILVFTLLFGGMVGVISKNGGARGIAELITRYAKTARGGQLSTLGMALVVFFDDYANILIRGNLMRPITDRLRISREKLSFLVDTGAAAVASTVLISTWIGYEVGLIEQGLRLIDSREDAYTMFVRSIPFRFYPIFAMVFAFLVGWTGRDFGPMLLAERRARKEGKVIRDGARPVTESLEDEKDAARAASWLNGLAPIVATLVIGVLGIYYTGSQSLEAGVEPSLGAIVSGADSYVALLWASLSGCAIAIVLAVGRRVLSLGEAFDAAVQGFKAMVMALVILVLAWSIGAATAELHAASYLVQVLEGALNPVWLPVLTFVIAAAMAFATGTSWATMAILMPLVIPLTNALGSSAGYDAQHIDTLLLGAISSVLAGAVFGDHCSPISDTTILSSMASASDHIDHVRTQLPYALLVAVVGMIVGDVPTAFGLSPWISIALGTAVLAAVLYFYAKPVDEPGDAA